MIPVKLFKNYAVPEIGMVFNAGKAFGEILRRVEDRADSLRPFDVPETEGGKEVARLNQRIKEAEELLAKRKDEANQAARLVKGLLEKDAPPAEIEAAEKAVALASLEAGVIQQRIAVLSNLREDKKQQSSMEHRAASRIAEEAHHAALKGRRAELMQRLPLDVIEELLAICLVVPAPAVSIEEDE